MYATILDNFPAFLTFLVLAGSLLGSAFAFPFSEPRHRARDRASSVPQGFRPQHWPARDRGTDARYTPRTESIHPTSRRRSPFPLLLVGGLAFLGAYAGLFAYKSPWSTETDMRHLAATLHCDVARRVGLAPTVKGAPGYHTRNDRDLNGVACESYEPMADVALGPVEAVQKLSPTSLRWPVDGKAETVRVAE